MRVGSKLTIAGAVAVMIASASGALADTKPRSGHAPKRGGYSVTTADTINTYGSSRTKYGSANVYRDPRLDSQTQAGPFDHGFFFDSGINARGGNSPYPN